MCMYDHSLVMVINDTGDATGTFHFYFRKHGNMSSLWPKTYGMTLQLVLNKCSIHIIHSVMFNCVMFTKPYSYKVFKSLCDGSTIKWD